MKIKLEKSNKLSRKYKVFVSKEEMSAEIDRQVVIKAPSIKMNGFRAGKVPHDTIKKAYTETLFRDSLNKLIEDARRQIVEENKFILATAPSLEGGENIKINSDIDFIINFELWPEIPTIKYEKISVTLPVVSLSDSELEKQIEKLAVRVADVVAVESPDHEVEKGNILNIDYSGSIDGVVFDGGTATGQTLEIGSGAFIPGFEEQLIGLKKDADAMVKVKFPDEYHSAELAGKNAEFKVKINSIFKKELPPIDDALAVKFGAKDMTELRQKVKESTLDQYKNAVKDIVRPRVINRIAKDYQFDLPESVLAKEVDARKKSLTESNSGKDKKETLSEKEIDKKATEESTKALHAAYLKNHWIDRYKIEITQQDFQKEIMEEAVRTGGSYQQTLGVYSQYPALKRYLVAEMEERKIFEEMFKLLTVKEKEMSKTAAEEYLEKLKSNQELL